MDLAESERVFWEGYFRIKGDTSTRKDEGNVNLGPVSPTKFRPYPFPRIEKHKIMEVA